MQGHGEVVLRGEVESKIEDDLAYLERLRQQVENAIERGLPVTALDDIGIERCGKSRIPLNGLVQDLHRANLHALYDEIFAQRAARS